MPCHTNRADHYRGRPGCLEQVDGREWAGEIVPRDIRERISTHKSLTASAVLLIVALGFYLAAPAFPGEIRVLTYAGSVTLLMSTFGFVLGSLRLLNQIETRLRTLVAENRREELASEVAKHPLWRTPLASVMREVVDAYLKAQDGGSFPITYAATEEISFSLLRAGFSDHGIPNSIANGYQIAWLKASYNESWRLSPVDDGDDCAMDPRDFLHGTTVATFEGYSQFAQYMRPRMARDVFFPVGAVLSGKDDFVDALRGVSFIRGRDSDRLWCEISRFSGDRRVAGPERVYFDRQLCSLDVAQRLARVAACFPSLRERKRDLSLASKAILEMYEVSRSADLPPSLLMNPRKDDRDSWEFKMEFDYVLPAEVRFDNETIFALTTYLRPINGATMLDSLSFKALRQSGLHFSWTRRPVVQCVLARAQPRLDENRWTWTPERALLPGDLMFVQWDWEPGAIGSAFLP